MVAPVLSRCSKDCQEECPGSVLMDFDLLSLELHLQGAHTLSSSWENKEVEATNRLYSKNYHLHYSHEDWRRPF